MSPAQEKMHALADRSREVRCANAALKERISRMPRAEAAREAAKIVRWPVDHEESLQVGALLQSVPTVGPTKTSELAMRQRIRLHAKLKQLPPGRREVVAEWLEGLK